jgi:hypothetical protein
MMIQKTKNTTKVCIKRKIGAEDSIPKCKINAVSKAKGPLRGELIIELKELQEKFVDMENINKKNIESLEQERETLEAINKKNLEVIVSLKEQVEDLKKEKPNQSWASDPKPDELDTSEGPRSFSPFLLRSLILS